MHQELFHVNLNFQLVLILHLSQVDHFFVANNLVLIMCVREEDLGLVISKGRIYNLKLHQYTGEFNWHVETKLYLIPVFLRLFFPNGTSSLN